MAEAGESSRKHRVMVEGLAIKLDALNVDDTQTNPS